jgi:hypothetical protein
LLVEQVKLIDMAEWGFWRMKQPWNLYRSLLMENRAQAQRRCMFGLSILKILFRMK